ncbi:hypothetical protein BH20VER1_BH20VER1_19040 [soil metagenome]
MTLDFLRGLSVFRFVRVHDRGQVPGLANPGSKGFPVGKLREDIEQPNG